MHKNSSNGYFNYIIVPIYKHWRQHNNYLFDEYGDHNRNLFNKKIIIISRRYYIEIKKEQDQIRIVFQNHKIGNKIPSSASIIVHMYMCLYIDFQDRKSVDYFQFAQLCTINTRNNSIAQLNGHQLSINMISGSLNLQFKCRRFNSKEYISASTGLPLLLLNKQ
ncbi:hypothetical protein ACTA71_011545 [Dictyostelium dimigraforme]